MDYYVYQGAEYCKDCGEQIKKELTEQGEAPDNPEDFSTFDSDDFPKGPFPRMQNESDVPEHCDRCGVFLENPLTDYGVDYVYRRVQQYVDNIDKGSNWNQDTIKEWLDYYSCHEKIAKLKSDLIDKGVEIAE